MKVPGMMVLWMLLLSAVQVLMLHSGGNGLVGAEEYRRHTNNWAVVVRFSSRALKAPTE